MHLFSFIAGGVFVGVPGILITIGYFVLSGLGQGGHRAVQLTEAARVEVGERARRAVVRRKARDLVEVEDEAEKIRAGR